MVKILCTFFLLYILLGIIQYILMKIVKIGFTDKNTGKEIKLTKEDYLVFCTFWVFFDLFFIKQILKGENEDG